MPFQGFEPGDHTVDPASGLFLCNFQPRVFERRFFRLAAHLPGALDQHVKACVQRLDLFRNIDVDHGISHL